MKSYDVMIIGSGASGGIAAKVLTEQGLEVLLLEAGPSISGSDFLTHHMPYHFPFRGVGSPSVIRKEGWLAAREQTPFDGYYTKSSQHPWGVGHCIGEGSPSAWRISISRVLRSTDTGSTGP